MCYSPLISDKKTSYVVTTWPKDAFQLFDSNKSQNIYILCSCLSSIIF